MHLAVLVMSISTNSIFHVYETCDSIMVLSLRIAFVPYQLLAFGLGDVFHVPITPHYFIGHQMVDEP